jgi:hypothetical protein
MANDVPQTVEEVLALELQTLHMIRDMALAGLADYPELHDYWMDEYRKIVTEIEEFHAGSN